MPQTPVDNPNGFRCVRTTSGGPPAIIEMPVASSETLVKGDAVILSSGLVSIALYDSGTILGVMAEDSTTQATNTLVKVYAASQCNIFEGQCSGTFSRAIGGTSVDIEGATSVMEINENLTNTQVVRVIGWNPNDSVAANTRARFIWARSSFNDYQDAE